MSEELPEDTYNRNDLVCPWCGYVDRDSWELDHEKEDGETQCAACDKPILWSRHTSISYTGRAIKP